MNIVQTMRDPDLFGPFFRAPTWLPWMAFLCALFGLPMDEALATIYREHTGRQTLPTALSREAVLLIGRRGGKSRILALIAVYLAVFVDFSEHLAPGEVGTVAIIAADRKQARSIFRFVQGMLTHVPMLKVLIESETVDSITLTNGVVIEIHTASYRSVRGTSLIAALLDECCFWRLEESSANPAAEVIQALRPGLANLPNSMLLMASSPYSRRGPMYDLWKRHYAKDGARVLVWQAPTLAMNPGLDPRIVEEALEEDPASATAEFLAQWRDDVSQYVNRDLIDSLVVPNRLELPRIASQTYKAFCDPSGGSADSMTLAIAHREKDVTILDAVREVKPPFSPEGVVKDFVALMKVYGVRTVEGDRYAGEWPREQFKKLGVDYKLSDRPKSDIYRDALPLMNSRMVELLDNQRLVAQLCSLERRTARGGRDSIDHPPSGHDDLSNSVCGALLMCGKSSYAEGWDWICSPEELHEPWNMPRWG